MFRTLRIAALLCLTAVLVAVPAAANAERWGSPDPQADVRGLQFVPEPLPCGDVVEVDATANSNQDITRLRVRHSRTHVLVRARFRDLDAALEQWVTFHLATNRGAWMLDVDRWQRRDGTFRNRIFLAETPEEPDEFGECGEYGYVVAGERCGTGPVIDHDADVVTAAIPRRCISNPRWVRVGVEAYGFLEPENGAPTYFHDQWGDEDDTDSLIVSPLGARVAAPRGAPLRQTAAAATTAVRRHSFGGLRYPWVRE